MITPIYQTSTFAQEAVGVNKGFDYARGANPTRTALEACLAALEARRTACLRLGPRRDARRRAPPRPGDHVVCVNDVYGGTYRISSRSTSHGLALHVRDTRAAPTDPATPVADARLVWIESPTNPLLNIVDIAAVAELAQAAGALSSSTTRSRRPISRPRSTSGRHRPPLDDQVPRRPLGRRRRRSPRRTTRRSPSGCASSRSRSAPCRAVRLLAVLRGLKTLAVRMERHCENARSVVEFLTGHPRVTRVLCPGSPSIPGTRSPRARCGDFGGMLSFLVETEEEAVELVSRTAVWTLAECLGSVESLIEHPARMTHASTATGPFAAPTNLVRLSVGIESADDLVTDLQSALTATPARA